jgi:hypothetical protein
MPHALKSVISFRLRSKILDRILDGLNPAPFAARVKVIDEHWRHGPIRCPLARRNQFLFMRLANLTELEYTAQSCMRRSSPSPANTGFRVGGRWSLILRKFGNSFTRHFRFFGRPKSSSEQINSADPDLSRLLAAVRAGVLAQVASLSFARPELSERSSLRRQRAGIKEIPRHHLERVPYHRLMQKILAPREVMEAEPVPEHDAFAFDGFAVYVAR